MPFNRPCIGAADMPCPTRSLTKDRSGRCETCRRRHWSQLRQTTRSGHNDRRWREFGWRAVGRCGSGLVRLIEVRLR